MKKTTITLLALAINLIGFAQQNFNRTTVWPHNQLADSISSILKEKHIPGAFVTVVSKDSILFQGGFGYAHVASKTPTTAEHLFKIGSISKTFTALAIMKLVEEGKLDLDDTLTEIAPEIPFKNKWESTHPVRVKHLLEHKAGFDDMPLSVLAVNRPAGMTALEEVLKNKGALKSRWQPGLGHSYSNPGYSILGYVIEKITQQPYQEYIANEVLAPLKMTETKFRSDFDAHLSSNNVATGYMYHDDVILESRDAKIIGEAAGSLLSNASDMGTFLQFILNKKMQDSLQIVSSTSLREMEIFHGDDEAEFNITNGYGLGLYSRTFGTSQLDFIGHSGGINGFGSDFIYNRKLDLGIAVSNNGEGNNGQLLDLLVDTFAQPSERIEHNRPIDMTQFKGWEGEYRMLTTRNQVFDFIQFPLETLTIEVSKDSLFLTRFLQDKDAFVHRGNTAFAKAEQPNPTLFLVEKDGKKYLNYNKDILVPVNGVGFLLLRMTLVFSLIIGILAMLVLLINLIIAAFNRRWRQTLKRNLVIAAPMVAFVLSIILFTSNLSLDQLETLGQFNMLSLSIFIATASFPILAIWATYWLYKNKEHISKRFSNIYYHLVVFGALFLSIYCIYHGWFMKMMWE